MRKKLRTGPAAVPQATKPKDFVRMMEIVEKEFFGCNQSQIAKGLGFTEGNYRNILRTQRVNLKAIAALARRGADVLYILTGESRPVAPVKVDVLTGLCEPPSSCPNHGLCGTLAKLAKLQKVLYSDEMLGSGRTQQVAEAALEAAILAAARSGKANTAPTEAGPSRETPESTGVG